jgi:hypothetical protein
VLLVEVGGVADALPEAEAAALPEAEAAELPEAEEAALPEAEAAAPVPLAAAVAPPTARAAHENAGLATGTAPPAAWLSPAAPGCSGSGVAVVGAVTRSPSLLHTAEDG